jgi:hypothetical protein
MNTGTDATVIGTFGDRNSARVSVDELLMAGFDEDEVRLTDKGQHVFVQVDCARDEAEEAQGILTRNGGEVSERLAH